MNKYTLPPRTLALVDHYLHLKVGGLVFRCPYYQNVWKRRKPAVFAGKGRPEEIEAQTRQLLKLKPSLKHASVKLLRFYLVQAGLGIDCSGFVGNVLSELIWETKKKSFYQLVPPSIFANWRRRLVFKLRPRLNLSARILTSSPLSEAIDFHQALPGDLIKFGNFHVALISAVWQEKNEIRKIEYVHSTSDYSEEHGVHQGLIFIKNPSLSLEKQIWQESDSQGRNWTKEDYLRADPRERGIRRLTILSK